MSGQVRVFTAMVGDLFHYGHVRLLKSAASLGNHLTVGLVSDERAASYKRVPILNYKEREEVIRACRYVDDVMKLDENITNSFMKNHNFQIRAYACANEEEEARNFVTLWKDMDQQYFKRIGYTEGISTSDLIDRLRGRFN